MVENVLLPVSSERDMQWAVDYVTRLCRQGRIRVHLLSVQTPFNGHVRMFFKDDDIAQFHREDGEKGTCAGEGSIGGSGRAVRIPRCSGLQRCHHRRIRAALPVQPHRHGAPA